MQWWSLMVLVLVSAPAYAYIDPNSGGLFFQLLTPLFVIIAAAFAFAKRQIARAWDSFVDRTRTLWLRLLRTLGAADKNPGAADK